MKQKKKHKQPVMVCITAQSRCERIIAAGKELADHLYTDLIVLTIQPKKQDAAQRAKDMKCLEDLSRKTGCEIVIRYSDHPIKSIAKHAAKAQPVHIFIGKSDDGSDFAGRLQLLFGAAPITMVGNEIIYTVPSLESLLPLFSSSVRTN